MIIDPAAEGSDTGSNRLSWTSQVLVWLMLLPTVGLMIFWNSIQTLTANSMRMFFG
jgi:hypothetical protein